jgi:MFS family permease
MWKIPRLFALILSPLILLVPEVKSFRNQELRNVRLPDVVDRRHPQRRVQHSCRHLGVPDKVVDDLACSNVEPPQHSTRSSPPPPVIWGLPRDTVAIPLALLLLSQFILFIGVGAIIPSIPLYAQEIGLTRAASGIVISAPAVAMLLFARTCAYHADLARKPGMILGMLLIAVADAGTALATNVVALLVARLALGVGRCWSEASERGLLADVTALVPERRGRAVAAHAAVQALGIAVGAPLGGVVVELYGPRAPFLCVSGAALMALALYTLLPETIIGSTTTTTTAVAGGSSRTTAAVGTATMQDEEGKLSGGDLKNDRSSSQQGDWRKLLESNPQWRGLALCQCGASFGFAAKIASIPILATAILPGGAIGAGALLSAAGLSGIVGAPVGGWLSDRTSARGTAILSGMVSATGLILVPLALQLPPSYGEIEVMFSFFGADMGIQASCFSAVVLLWSLGASSQGPALTALAQELSPLGAEATAMALPRATGDATYIVAPFILGLVTDYTLSMPGIECAVAGVMTLVGVAALVLLGGIPASESLDKPYL